MAERTLFFVDFDGVICDSLQECLYSAWTAYYTLYLGEKPAFASLQFKARFYAGRPFIRNSEDYLILCDAIHRGIQTGSQAAFDALIAGAGKEKLTRFRGFFHTARSTILAGDRDFWMGLNRIYPHMECLFAGAGGSRDYFILSTKHPEFIREIFLHNGITVPEDRILYPAERTKYEVILDVMERENAPRAAFLDDQIDHLLGARDSRISLYLPLWGYVLPGWAADPRVIPLNTEDAVKMLSRVIP
jgi:phosphoglycolate phosphatase-like HAD superfamily hydrolase